MNDHTDIGPASRPFQTFFRLADIMVLGWSYYLAYLTVPLVRSIVVPLESFSDFGPLTLVTALLIPPVWLAILQLRGLYGDPARIPYSTLVVRTLQVTLLGLGIVTLILFAFKQEELSRLLLYIFGIYSCVFLIGIRTAAKWYFVNRHRTGRYAATTLVIGVPEDVQVVQTAIAEGDTLKDCKIIGYFDGHSSSVDANSLVPCPAKLHDLNHELATRPISEVLLIWDSQEDSDFRSVVDTCREMGVRLRIIPRFALHYRASTLSEIDSRAESYWGMPSIVLTSVKWRAEDEFVKRIMDIIISAFLLVLLSPLFLIIGIAVKLSSAGPVFYRWKVLGRNNSEFVGYKFRTMVVNADELKASLLAQNEMHGPVFKMKKDPRVTGLGRILRKYSLDELPQLWSVLVGDMSLVGPRPVFRSEFERFQFWEMRKLSIRPGITCLWQVNGRNKISNSEDWIKLDLRYIDNWTLWLDIKILFQTALAVVRGTGH